jgi:voltage-dependent calcium channel L type alpha-1D
VSEIGNFSVFLLLFMYVYALLGMQIFGNRFRFDPNGIPITSPAAATDADEYVPRANFDSLLWSGVTVFQVLTGENWNNVLFDGWRTIGLPAVLYFVSLVVFGNFIVLNLFLAILLSHFEDAEEASQEANNTEAKEALRTKSRVMPMMSSASMLPAENGRGNTRRRITPANTDHVATGSPAHSLQQQSNRDSQSSVTKVSGRMGQSSGRTMASYHSRRMSKTELTNMVPAELLVLKAKTPQGKSLFLFGPYNPLRRFAWNIITHPRFDGAVLGFVITSTVCVALDNPLSDPDSVFVNVVGYVDSVLVAVFVVEVVIKIVAQGLCMSPTAYLRNGWNVMDFVITAVSIPSLPFISDGDSQQLKFISSLRTFRALRPLRMINRNPGLKLVVSSLVSAIPQMLNVGMVCLLLLLIFSIIAVNNLKGRFFACTGDVFESLSDAQRSLITTPRAWMDLSSVEKLWFDESTAELYANASSASSGVLAGVDGVTSRMVCSYLNASWERTIPQSFDNVLMALLTFYEISTTEGWVTLMLAGVDATDVDMQPIPNHQEGWALFFIAFIFLGSFFFIQLFIGVVIENFNRMKETLDGTRMLSCSQREWLLISQAVLKLRPMRKIRAPRSAIRLYCFRWARSSQLETVTMGAITLNTFIMGLTYFGEEDLYSTIIEYANIFFTVLFALEAAIKITGLGRYYWKEPWNIFDFVVAMGSCFGTIYTMVGGDAVGSTAAMIRGVRVLRLIRLIQTAPSLRQLVNTLLFTLPSLINIGAFLLLVFFMYAAVGVQLFAKVKLGELVTPVANFQSISVAMITLVSRRNRRSAPPPPCHSPIFVLLCRYAAPRGRSGMTSCTSSLQPTTA